MPTPGSLFIDAALTRASAGRAQDIYAGTRVLPTLPVQKQTGLAFNSDPTNQRLRILDTQRTAGAEANRFDQEDPTTLSYACTDHALEGLVTDEEMESADPATMPDLVNVNMLGDQVLRKYEDDLIVLLNTLGQTSVPGTAWNLAAGTPIADMEDEFKTIEDARGATPNAVALDIHVLRSIKKTTEWKDQVQFVLGPDARNTLAAADLLADMLSIPRGNVIVSKAFKNTALQGQPSVIVRIWDEDVLVFFTEPPSLQSPGLGITPVWMGAGAAEGWMVERERDARRKGDALIVHYYYDQLLLNANSGFLHTAVLT